MSTTELNAWGFQSDNDQTLVSKSGGKFGLNTGNITVFEYTPNGGKGGSPTDAILITYVVGEKEYRNRIFDITGSLYKGSDKISPDEPGYAALYNAEIKQRQAVVIHIVKSLGVTEEQIKNALVAGQPTSFATWAAIMCSLPGAGFESKPVDAFLEYQSNIQDGQNKTYLQLPKNMKGGYFLCPHVAPVGEEFEEIRENKKLIYKDSAGNEHPFFRSANYMESKKANQTFEDGYQPESTQESTETTTSAPSSGQW